MHFSFFSPGGYYNIELAGSKLRLISLNMNLYLEEVAEETKLMHRNKVTQPEAVFLVVCDPSMKEL
jgi:hypothetical protein